MDSEQICSTALGLVSIADEAVSLNAVLVLGKARAACTCVTFRLAMKKEVL